jgi:hypothetical protein
MKQAALLATCFMLVCLLNGLYGIISQKTELFITTAVRNSNPT